MRHLLALALFASLLFALPAAAEGALWTREYGGREQDHRASAPHVRRAEHGEGGGRVVRAAGLPRGQLHARAHTPLRADAQPLAACAFAAEHEGKRAVRVGVGRAHRRPPRVRRAQAPAHAAVGIEHENPAGFAGARARGEVAVGGKGAARGEQAVARGDQLAEPVLAAPTVRALPKHLLRDRRKGKDEGGKQRERGQQAHGGSLPSKGFSGCHCARSMTSRS